MCGNRLRVIQSYQLVFCRTTQFVYLPPKDQTFPLSLELCKFPVRVVFLSTNFLDKFVHQTIHKFRSRVSCRLCIPLRISCRLAKCKLRYRPCCCLAILLCTLGHLAMCKFLDLLFCFQTIHHRICYRHSNCKYLCRASFLPNIHQCKRIRQSNFPRRDRVKDHPSTFLRI